VNLSLLFILSTATASQPVKLSTEDGQRIQAKSWKTRGSTRGVVLVHGEDQSSKIWNSTAQTLSDQGITVLSIDLRGHGESSIADGASLEETDYKAMTQDVLAASQWMERNGVEQITCLGSSLGANLCLQAGAASSSIDRMALLSPGFNYLGVTSVSSASNVGERPILVLFSEEDKYALQTSLVLSDRASGPIQIEARSGLGHGTRMLARDPELEELLLNWLTRPETPSD